MNLRVCSVAVLLICAATAPARGQFDFDTPPIEYSTKPVTTDVTRLQADLDAGKTTLDYDERHSYLASLLKHLDIPVSSQALVFSKTSLQGRRITPRAPRAIYFNDDTYVGWVPSGDTIEIMSTDPVQGEIFYTLDRERVDRPVIARNQDNCLSCHATVRTQKVPGALVRSVFPDSSGQPQLASGSFVTDHTSPFEERWGGWYVTGTHGRMRHMGNTCLQEGEGRNDFDREAGANVTDLAGRCDIRRQLTPHSDIVALMVLERQTQMHNFLTLASYECRSANHYDKTMNAVLERPEDFVSDVTKRRIRSAGEKLVEALLYSGEFPLTDEVRGTSTFAQDFSARGPRDSQGRSLRDFDLKTRMFRYPCSHLIYTPAFDQLPREMKRYVVGRLDEILTGKDTTEPFRHLSPEDRAAIRAILLETKPGLFAPDDKEDSPLPG